MWVFETILIQKTELPLLSLRGDLYIDSKPNAIVSIVHFRDYDKIGDCIL